MSSTSLAHLDPTSVLNWKGWAGQSETRTPGTTALAPQTPRVAVEGTIKQPWLPRPGHWGPLSITQAPVGSGPKLGPDAFHSTIPQMCMCPALYRAPRNGREQARFLGISCNVFQVSGCSAEY